MFYLKHGVKSRDMIYLNIRAKVINLKKGDTKMSENKRYRWHVIHDRIRDIPSPIGAEIGVHRGECSAHLLEMHPGLKLYMIDMWSPDTYKGKGDDAATEPYRELYEKGCNWNYNEARNVLLKYEKRAEILKLSSLEAVNMIEDGFLDFAFIDASHAYEDVKADSIAWLPKIKKGGYLIMHDFDNPSFPGVRQAIEEIFSGYILEIDSDYMAVIRV
jgi:hypothetical protein